jgi:hypothetical protein
MRAHGMIVAIAGAGLLASAGVVTAGTLDAAAAPTSAPRSQTFTISCSNGHTYEAVAPPGANSMQGKSTTPAIIVSGGKGVLVPTTLTFTLDGFSFTKVRGQGNPNANELSCSATLPNGATVSAKGFLAG